MEDYKPGSIFVWFIIWTFKFKNLLNSLSKCASKYSVDYYFPLSLIRIDLSFEANKRFLCFIRYCLIVAKGYAQPYIKIFKECETFTIIAQNQIRRDPVVLDKLLMFQLGRDFAEQRLCLD